MDCRTVPVVLSLLLCHGGPLCLEMLQELSQGLDSGGGIDGGTTGDDEGIDKAPRVEKCHDHLFGLIGMDPRL